MTTSARSMLLHNATRGTTLCSTVASATTYWQRLRGLLGRPEQQPGEGLLLLPSSGVHTFGMRHAIDVVFLSSDLQVLRICSHVAPRRVRLPARTTHCVLEMRKGEAERNDLAVGDRLQLQGVEAPKSLTTEQRMTSTPSVRSRRLLWMLLAVLLSVQAVLCWTARKPSLEGRVDLRAYYAAGTNARLHGVDGLYSDAAEQHTQQVLFHDGWRTLHFLYPPFAVLPYRALAALPYRSAFALVSACSLLCLLLSAWLLLGRFRAPLSSPVLFLCALCAFPCVIALAQGQVSFPLLLILTLFYCLHRAGWPVLAGLCLAAGLFKFQVVLPVALLYLLWRRYRIVAGFAAGAVLLGAASLDMVGVAGMVAYLHRLHALGTATLLDQAAAHLRYGMQMAAEPNLHGLATLLAGNGAHSAVLTLLLSLSVLVWSACQGESTATAVCAAVLLSYHLQPYDLVLLLLPLALHALPLLQQRLQHGVVRHRSDLWLLAGSAALLCAPVAGTLMLLHATTAYALAPLALLWVSRTPRQPETATEHLAALAVRQPTLSLAS